MSLVTIAPHTWTRVAHTPLEVQHDGNAVTHLGLEADGTVNLCDDVAWSVRVRPLGMTVLDSIAERPQVLYLGSGALVALLTGDGGILQDGGLPELSARDRALAAALVKLAAQRLGLTVVGEVE